MSALDEAVERAWYGQGLGARAARAALAPAAAAFAGLSAARNALYDRGLLRSDVLALPAIGVGNLTVGGTGKTPVAAWIAESLLERGARPAIVLRGYGGDEPLVHAMLNPEAVVVASRDRVAAVREARSSGADVAVLDDAFQHRRARRDLDLVLVSADRWDGTLRALPAGPWREGLGALRRAAMVLVTRKAAGAARATSVAAELRAAAPGVPAGIAHLAPAGLRSADDGALPLGALAGARVLAVSAIGDPAAFEAQLGALGAVVERAAFRDHHAFTADDVARLAARAEGAELAVCTLKDAVKLWPVWPRGARPLWYVSQRVSAERGGDDVVALLDRLLDARVRG